MGREQKTKGALASTLDTLYNGSDSNHTGINYKHISTAPKQGLWPGAVCRIDHVVRASARQYHVMIDFSEWCARVIWIRNTGRSCNVFVGQVPRLGWQAWWGTETEHGLRTGMIRIETSCVKNINNHLWRLRCWVCLVRFGNTDMHTHGDLYASA